MLSRDREPTPAIPSLAADIHATTIRGMTLADVAIGYAGRGWPVFPLEPGAKRPAGRLVPHGLKQATADPGQIRAWWQAEPRANIGLVTGVGFDALDLDGAVAEAELDRAFAGRPYDDEGLTDDVLIGPTVRTPRGYHLYVAPTGYGNRAGILPGVDWRGQGGYVVAPGSVLAGDARRWEWELPDDPLYGHDATIRPAPAWLLEYVAPTPPPLAAQTLDAVFRVRNRRYGGQALDAELGRLAVAAEGERNHTLCQAAFRMGQLIAAGQLDAAQVIDALGAVAMRIGLTETETVATIKSGLDAGMARPRRTA